MADLTGKNILLVIPKNQFDDAELSRTRAVLDATGARIVILSKSGQSAVGMNKTRITPDSRIVDWNKQAGVAGKYHAVLVMGGKGAPKSLWDDDILPQILTDHYRAERVIGAIGLGVAVLARTGLLAGDTAGPDDEKFLAELEQAGVAPSPDAITHYGNVITARDATAAEKFAQTVVAVLAKT